MNCPRCNSSHLQKKGKRAGKQRYKCVDCNASFAENTLYKPSVTGKSIFKGKCPKCGSNNIKRDGKLKNGGQRFYCKDCGLGFSTKTNLLAVKEIEWKCPYCGNALSYSGFSKSGTREYICKSCKKSCTADKEGRPIKRNPAFAQTNREIKCPACESTNVKKAGIVKGKQRYLCKNCNRAFTNKKVRISKEKLIEIILEGRNIDNIVKISTYTLEEINEIMKPYYEKEVVTDSQIRDIIRYGYYLNVPINYMAEYVKCSENKCEEILRKYREKIKSTTLGAT